MLTARGTGRTRGERPLRALFLFGLLTAVALLAVACGSPKPSSSSTSTAATASTKPTAVTLPDTPVGIQAGWLVAATAHLPISATDVRAHFDATFLGKVSPATLNQVLKGTPKVAVVSIEASQADSLVTIVSAGGTQLQVTLDVDAQGLISGLLIAPAPLPAPTTWEGVDAALRSVAPEVHLLVANVTNGSLQPVHSIDPATAAPLGSMFKLYVLDALGDAVASGKVTWNQPLTITAQLKSLPSGELQTKPDGTQISVQDVATKMISISDNTAADMLIDLVGRPAVEAALTATGMADPSRSRPFLTTREMFGLKLDQWPTLAKQYIAADAAARRNLLASSVDPAPLPDLAQAEAWTTPRDIDSIEWFASANDISRVYASLVALARQPGLSPIAQVLSLNDGGLRLEPAEWKTTWFKGGSEPGVLTLAYLATTQAGQSYVVVALAENPSKPIDEATAAPAMLAVIKGAFTLAAGS